jgi:hypothetical protein
LPEIIIESTLFLEDAREDGPLPLNAEGESSNGQGDTFMYFVSWLKHVIAYNML